MNSEERTKKIKQLKTSPLWISLLSDKEIRYSDFLGLFIEKYKFNPFVHEQNEITIDFEVNREKKNTDLWLERIEVINSNESESTVIRISEDYSHDEMDIVRFPWILIENKLKSVPFIEQLEDYTKSFVNAYISQVNNYIRKKYAKTKDKEEQPKKSKEERKQIDIDKKNERLRLLQEIEQLKFYLISPLIWEKTNPKISLFRKGLPNGKFEFEWKQISYSEIGNILKKCLKSERSNGYLDDLFLDFANVLDSLTVFDKALESLKPDTPIIELFKPENKPGFEECENMHPLYVKVKASQCAQALSDRFKSEGFNVEVSRTPALKMKKDKIFIHHDFSRKDSLFEVKKCIQEEELIVVIQYQRGELRKGIVVAQEDIGKYNKWLGQPWGEISFSLNEKNNKPYSYRINDRMGFYYYKYKCTNETVEQILKLMMDNIQLDNLSLL